MVDLSPYAGAKGRTTATLRTSADAADAIAPSRSKYLRIALRDLAALGAATPLEVVARTGLPRETILPRLSELIEMGLAETTGARRRNPSGRSAAVLRLTSAGKAELATT